MRAIPAILVAVLIGCGAPDTSVNFICKSVRTESISTNSYNNIEHIIVTADGRTIRHRVSPYSSTLAILNSVEPGKECVIHYHHNATYAEATVYKVEVLD